ncbi:MAG: LptA/OstA family protein [Acidobacteriota bacterium]
MAKRRRSRSILRKLRWIVGIVLLVTLVAVGYQLSRVQRTVKVPIADEVLGDDEVARQAPPDTQVGTSRDVRMPRTGELRMLEADQGDALPDGSLALTGNVRVELDGPGGTGGPGHVITSKRGRYPGKAGGPLELREDVVVVGPEQLRLEGDDIDVDRNAQLLMSKGPTVFRRGELSGNSGWLNHDWGEGRTELGGGAVARITGARSRGESIDLVGQRIVFDRAGGQVELHQAASLSFAGGRVRGARVDAWLSEDRQDVSRVEARGQAESEARIADSGGGERRRRLRAGTIVHVFGAATRLESIEAEGDVVLVTEGGTGERLSGDEALLEFGGELGGDPWLRRLVLIGTPARMALTSEGQTRRAEAARLELELDRDGTARRLVGEGDARLDDAHDAVQADRYSIELDENGRVSSVEFSGTPGRLDRQPPGEQRQTLIAQEAVIQLGPGDTIEEGTLTGEVEILGRDVVAKGRKGQLGNDVLTLTGEASVESDGRVSHGDEVIFDRANNTVTVRGNQHTIIKGSSTPAGLSTLDAGEQDEPILVSSGQLVLFDARREAIYSSPDGNGPRPHLRRGDTLLRADTITVNEELQTLLAEGNVESRLRLAAPSGGHAQENTMSVIDPSRLIDGRCQELLYESEKGRLLYRDEVELSQSPVSLRGDVVDVGIDAEGGLQTLLATGLALYQGPQVEAEGQRIEYDAATGNVRVEAGRRPARAKHAQGLVSGGVLELSMGDDGVRVLSPAGGRSRGISSVTAGAVVPAAASEGAGGE